MKKERLYLYELLDDPAVSYPAWYLLSPKLHRDENLRETLRAIHRADFSPYASPASFDDLFASFRAGCYPIYRERAAAGYFAGKVMVLESNGWKGLPLNEETTALENWLV